MRVIEVHRAQGTGTAGVEPATININTVVPAELGANWQAVNMRVFRDDAALLEAVLNTVLPGGTYDQLLARMLERKASHFVVPFADIEREVGA